MEKSDPGLGLCNVLCIASLKPLACFLDIAFTVIDPLYLVIFYVPHSMTLCQSTSCYKLLLYYVSLFLESFHIFFAQTVYVYYLKLMN